MLKVSCTSMVWNILDNGAGVGDKAVDVIDDFPVGEEAVDVIDDFPYKLTKKRYNG